jgi:hypothetical protein
MLVKFRYSEKATKISIISWHYSLMSNWKWNTGQIFEAFSEYLSCILTCFYQNNPGANIVFESRRRRAGLVFQNLAFSGWVSHNTHALYLEISCRNDVTNLWLSFSIPTKKCVKAQTDPYSQFIHPYIAICKVSLKTVSEQSVKLLEVWWISIVCKNRFLQPEIQYWNVPKVQSRTLTSSR